MSFSQPLLTNAGKQIELQGLQGAEVVFTKIKIGDGSLTTQEPRTLTDLISTIATGGIVEIKKYDVYANVKSVFQNTELSTGFYWREIGLFALDPATGNEVLYAYQNAYETAEYIEPAALTTKKINWTIYIDDGMQLGADIRKDMVYLTIVDMDEHNQDEEAHPYIQGLIDDHKTDPNAHDYLFSSVDFYVATTGSDSNNGEEGTPFRTIQHAVDSIPQGCSKATINIANGTYNEAVLVYNTTTSIISFNGEDKNTTIVNSIQARENSIVSVSKITFNTTGSVSLLFHNTKGRVYDIIINGSTNTTGVYAYGADTDVEETAINNCLRATYNDRGFIQCQKVSGSGNTYAYVAGGGVTLIGNSCTLTATNFKMITSSGYVIEQAMATSLTIGVADSTTAISDSSKKLATTEWITGQIVAESHTELISYIRYSNGHQFVWGVVPSYTANTIGGIIFSIPVTFLITTPVTVLVTNKPDADLGTMRTFSGGACTQSQYVVDNKTNYLSVFDKYYSNIGQYVSVGFQFIAMGRWK